MHKLEQCHYRLRHVFREISIFVIFNTLVIILISGINEKQPFSNRSLGKGKFET